MPSQHGECRHGFLPVDPETLLKVLRIVVRSVFGQSPVEVFPRLPFACGEVNATETKVSLDDPARLGGCPGGADDDDSLFLFRVIFALFVNRPRNGEHAFGIRLQGRRAALLTSPGENHAKFGAVFDLVTDDSTGVEADDADAL